MLRRLGRPADVKRMLQTSPHRPVVTNSNRASAAKTTSAFSNQNADVANAPTAQRAYDADLPSLAFSQSPIAMALVAADHRFIRANVAFHKLVGLADGALIGRTFEAITHPDDINTDAELARALLAGQFAHYEMEKRYLNPAGGVIWIHLTASLVCDEHNAAICALAIVRPIAAPITPVAPLDRTRLSADAGDDDLARIRAAVLAW